MFVRKDDANPGNRWHGGNDGMQANSYLQILSKWIKRLIALLMTIRWGVPCMYVGGGFFFNGDPQTIGCNGFQYENGPGVTPFQGGYLSILTPTR